MPQITVKAGVGTTFLKTHPWQIAASAGKPEFKAFKCPEFNQDKTRKTLAVNSTGLSQDIDGHAAITFDPPLTIGGNKYSKLFVAMCHWDGLDALIKNKVATDSPFSAAGSGKLLLPVTYRSQVDNSDSTGQGPGWRQCQLTSVSMLLEAWKGKDWLLAQSKGFAQPEDWYASKLTAIGGETTDGAAHVKLLNQMGFTCTYRFDMSLSELKELLDRAIGSAIGNRYKAGGHITYAAGKDLVKGGLYIHDPYGRRTMSDTQMFDTWDEVGGDGGKYRYHPLAVVKDCWLDMGDSAGWGIWPADSIVGHAYQKPAVTLSAAPAVTTPPPAAAAAATAPIACNVATVLKAECKASTALAPDQKLAVAKGYTVVKVLGKGADGHLQFELTDGRKMYGYGKHWDTPTGISNAFPGKGIIGLDKVKLHAAVEKLSADGVKVPECTEFVEAFWRYAPEWTIVNRVQTIHFLSQIWVESGALRYKKEDCGGDESYFDMYDPEHPGDTYMGCFPGSGRKYPGRGILQVTWPDNYRDCAKATGLDCFNNPTLLEVYPGALISALWFWRKNGLAAVSSAGLTDAVTTQVTHIVNGGENHLTQRCEWRSKFEAIL
jgi:predicted chitinase